MTNNTYYAFDVEYFFGQPWTTVEDNIFGIRKISKNEAEKIEKYYNANEFTQTWVFHSYKEAVDAFRKLLLIA
jgi:hypothetical protein